MTVKKGDMIGKASTLVELKDENNFETEDENVKQQINEMKFDNLIPEEQKITIKELLMDRRNVFSNDKGDIGRANLPPYKLKLTDNTPIWQKPRRFAPPINSEINKHFNFHLDLPRLYRS